MITLDMMGKACPIPMIETRKIINGLNGKAESIQVLVDNEIACENIKKMADGLGYKNSHRKVTDGQYVMEVIVGEGVSQGKVDEAKEEAPAAKKAQPSTGEGTVVAIGKDTMGDGDPSLGKILIKGFIYSLTELEEVPSQVLFFNSGAKLVCEGSNTVEDIKKLVELGTEVFVCGTCVDFYNLKDKVAVGEITNMYGIVTALSKGNKVINI
ncbi:MAG TPA: sulfurtransferase-like selenium metabolism protein YedF [Candidatus Merdenecus merdavium]|nr:sulfurtransferase-like selenium metabolism protein YedF [Candidatus Merdenecus merdavium]